MTPGSSLAEETSAAQELLRCLEEEQRQLTSAQVDSLPDTVARKAVMVSRMSTLAQRRHRLLAAAGHAASEAGMQSWLQLQPGFEAAWQELLELARRARELNQTNGILINTQLARTRAALSVLQQRPQGSTVYGPDGQQDLSAGGRTLVVG